MKFFKDSSQWPRDSLKRALLLNYPGCKSSLDALALRKKELSSQELTASQTPSLNQDYIIMRDIINELTSLITFDIDELDIETRLRLANINDSIEWKNAWLHVLGSRGKHEEQVQSTENERL